MVQIKEWEGRGPHQDSCLCPKEGCMYGSEIDLRTASWILRRMLSAFLHGVESILLM